MCFGLLWLLATRLGFGWIMLVDFVLWVLCAVAFGCSFVACWFSCIAFWVGAIMLIVNWFEWFRRGGSCGLALYVCVI